MRYLTGKVIHFSYIKLLLHKMSDEINLDIDEIIAVELSQHDNLRNSALKFK